LIFLVFLFAYFASIMGVAAAGSSARRAIYGRGHILSAGNTADGVSWRTEIGVEPPLPNGKFLVTSTGLIALITTGLSIVVGYVIFSDELADSCGEDAASAVAFLFASASMWWWTFAKYRQANSTGIRTKLPSIWWAALATPLFALIALGMLWGIAMEGC
jgi:hypothetical protein